MTKAAEVKAKRGPGSEYWAVCPVCTRERGIRHGAVKRHRRWIPRWWLPFTGEMIHCEGSGQKPLNTNPKEN